MSYISDKFIKNLNNAIMSLMNDKFFMAKFSSINVSLDSDKYTIKLFTKYNTEESSIVNIKVFKNSDLFSISFDYNSPQTFYFKDCGQPYVLNGETLNDTKILTYKIPSEVELKDFLSKINNYFSHENNDLIKENLFKLFIVYNN